MASRPPAPGLFSTTTGVPSASAAYPRRPARGYLLVRPRKTHEQTDRTHWIFSAFAALMPPSNAATAIPCSPAATAATMAGAKPRAELTPWACLPTRP